MTGRHHRHHRHGRDLPIILAGLAISMLIVLGIAVAFFMLNQDNDLMPDVRVSSPIERK